MPDAGRADVRCRWTPKGAGGRVRSPCGLDIEFPLVSGILLGNAATAVLVRSGFRLTLPYAGWMAKTGRLELRVESGLLARLDERCEVLGQTRTKFIERALESALSAGGVAGTPGVVRSHRRGDEQAPSANTSAEVPSASSRASGQAPTGPHIGGTLPKPLAPKPVPGVRPAREFVLDPRQARLNKAKGS